MAKQQGWVKLNRSFMEHAFWTEERTFSRAEAWIDLLLSASYGAGSFMVNGQMVRVEPGQYCTTMVYLSNRWGWSRFKVDSFLKMLKNNEMISLKKTSKYTLITLLNWAKYQYEDGQEMHEKSMKQASDMHQTSIKQALYKNVKNIKNDKKGKNNICAYPNQKNWGIRPAYKPYETDDVDLSEFEE